METRCPYCNSTIEQIVEPLFETKEADYVRFVCSNEECGYTYSLWMLK